MTPETTWENLPDEALWLLQQYPHWRVLGERYAALTPMLFGKWRLKVGPVSRLTVWAYRDDAEYCYESFDQAKAAMEAYDGVEEPSGWFRCPSDGRRRPDGDASREEVRA